MKRIILFILLIANIGAFAQYKYSEFPKSDTLHDSTLFAISQYMGKKISNPAVDSFKTYAIYWKDVRALGLDTSGVALYPIINTKIGGSGTSGYLPKFTASGTVGNSLIRDNGSNVGINTAANNSFLVLAEGGKLISIGAINNKVSSGSEDLFGISSTVTGTSSDANTTFYGISGSVQSATHTGVNIGVYGGGVVTGGSKNIGGSFEASGGSANYGVRLKDGTEAVGRKLQCKTVDGDANWVNDSSAYKQDRLTGTGFVKSTNGVVSYDNSTFTPTSRTLSINGTTYDLSANRSWTISSGGTTPKTIYVVDSLNGGRDASGDGTMAKPFATPYYGQQAANNRGFMTVSCFGSFTPTRSLGGVDSLTWQLNNSLFTVSSVSGTYLFDFTGTTTPITILGNATIKCSNAKGFYNNPTTQNDYVNVYWVDNTSTANSIVTGNASGTNESIINAEMITNSGTGYNIYIVAGNPSYFTINCPYVYRTNASNSNIYFDQSGARITINGNLINTTAGNIFAHSGFSYLIVNGNIKSTNVGTIGNGLAGNQSFVQNGKLEGSFSVYGVFVLNGYYVGGTFTTGTGSATFNGASSGNLTVASDSKCILNSQSSFYLTSSSAGICVFNGGLASLTDIYGTVYVNNYVNTSYLYVRGSAKLILNAVLTGDDNTKPCIYCVATGTIELGSLAVLTGTSNTGINFLGNATLITNGTPRILTANSCFNTGGNTVTWYNYGSIYSKYTYAGGGTVTQVVTLNGGQINADINFIK